MVTIDPLLFALRSGALIDGAPEQEGQMWKVRSGAKPLKATAA